MLNLNILWWGRSDIHYSRNRVIRKCLARLGCSFTDFRPLLSSLGGIEAQLRRLSSPSLVWVPCFRQRDMQSALTWSRKQQVPLVFDPLISAFDKQIFERKKFSAESKQGIKLLNWEKQLFRQADLVIGDTREHCNYFHGTFAVERSKLVDIPVGAEESLFKPATPQTQPTTPIRILFYGSYLGLQGPQYIIEAAKHYTGPPVQWQMIGAGPLLEQCKEAAQGLKNIEFLPWVAYEELPKSIQSADILLGIFGTSAKAHRVIPNKVYQTLACGKPLITMHSPAYPRDLLSHSNAGIHWVPPGDPKQLAITIAKLATEPLQLQDMGKLAQQTFRKYFSEAEIEQRLHKALKHFCSL